MVTEDGAWDLKAFKERLSEEIVRKITSIPPPHPLANLDKFFWIHTANRGFSVKSAYHMLKETTWNESMSIRSVFERALDRVCHV